MQAQKTLKITALLLALAFSWAACNTTSTQVKAPPPHDHGSLKKRLPPDKQPPKDEQASKKPKNLKTAVLKDHDTLVVPSGYDNGDEEYDLKPFLAALHGVTEAKVRMSQGEAEVEFDTEDCPNDATDTYELEYQVNAKDYALDIECADSSTGLPDSVDEGFLFLAGNKIYMYTLDDNDGKKDKVPISAGELLFFSAASKNLNASKKLRRQEITFKGDDDETEASEVGAVLAFGAAGDVKVEDTTLGTAGAAKGDGFLFIAVHWGTDDGADDFFGLGQDEEDNVQKAQPSSGSNNDDNDDSGGGNSGDDDDNDGDSGDSSGDGDGAGGSNDDGDGAGGSGDSSGDDDNDNNDGDDGDNGDMGGNNDDDDSDGENGDTGDSGSGNGDSSDGDSGDNDHTISEVCGKKPQSGADGTSCTCKLNATDTTDAAGVVASGICVVNNLCGTKTHTATNNADCTCKAAAGDAQEVPGLVASNVCYDKSLVCGHKTVRGIDGAECICKMRADSTTDSAGGVDGNICLATVICGLKHAKSGETEGDACKCKPAKSFRFHVNGITKYYVDGIIKNNKCVKNYVCGEKILPSTHGDRCECSLEGTSSKYALLPGRKKLNRCVASEVCGEKRLSSGAAGAFCRCKKGGDNSDDDVQGLIRWKESSPGSYQKICARQPACGTVQSSLPKGSPCKCEHNGCVVNGRVYSANICRAVWVFSSSCSL